MFAMCTNENGIWQLGYQNFNQKFLANEGVSVYFGNVFLPFEGKKLPVIKSKLRQILVDFGLSKTHVEINQELGSVTIWYRDSKSKELRGNLLQRYNDKWHKKSQAIEISISLEGGLSSPSSDGQVRTYDGLTRLIYQEFIQPVESVGIPESIAFYSKLQETIQKGNLAACVPLESILIEGVE